MNCYQFILSLDFFLFDTIMFVVVLFPDEFLAVNLVLSFALEFKEMNAAYHRILYGSVS